jgi:hypothetical protein
MREKPVTVKNAYAARVGDQNLRYVPVIDLIVAILAMIATAAVSTP